MAESRTLHHAKHIKQQKQKGKTFLCDCSSACMEFFMYEKMLRLKKTQVSVFGSNEQFEFLHKMITKGIQ